MHIKSWTGKGDRIAYERSKNGKEWKPCTRNDVRAALGWSGVREVGFGNVVTSENGVKYRKRG